MRIFFVFILLAFSTILPKNYEAIKDQFNLKILTPSLQNRTTAKIKLDNGLTVLIISDPEIKESAAAMAVNAGSWNDPERYPGTAHFTEHMLFQGTKKYPDRNDFFKFISDLGGNLNAYTSLEKTVYMFYVNNDSFAEGMKRFSQFFISPLFDPSAISSELFAVDQEHAKNIQNDMRRMTQVWKETSNKKHPHHQFATGNSQTLSAIPRDELIKWHGEYYRSSCMRLVVYSSDTLENSIKMVTELFQDIPSGEDKKTAPLPELSSDLQKGHIIYIKPIKEIQQLFLQWELPSELADDETKSAELVAYCINAAHKNSLLNALKEEHLVDNLSATISNIGKHSALFNIALNLTDEGVEKRDKVILTCFELIDSLKKNGVPPFLFEEFNTISKLEYQYQTRLDAFNFVEETANGILLEDISTFPQKTLFASSYSPKTIGKVTSSLSSDLCQIYLMANPKKTGIEPKIKEKWVNVEYSIEDLSLSLSKDLVELKQNSFFSSPIPNPFLPSNLSLVLEENKELFPIKIYNDTFGVGYFIPTSFHTPEIHWIFKIKTPLFDGSHRSYVLFDLFCKNLSDTLNDEILQAKLSGLSTSLDVGINELTLQIRGYSEKASLLLDIILKKMASSSFSKDEFENLQKFYQKIYDNSRFNLPVNQASDEMSVVLNSKHPSNEEKLRILNTVSYEELSKFTASIFDKTFIESTFTGNLTIKSCEGIWQSMQSIISHSPYDTIPDYKKVLSLSSGPYQVIKKTDIMGSGIILAIDENPFSFKRMAAGDILSQSIKEPFFSEMRSKQKAAYFASAWNLEKEKHLFQIFAVQSGTISPSELLYRFEIFIDEFSDKIEKNIDKDRFEKIKDNIIFELKKPPKNLDETATKYSLLAYTYKDFAWIEKRINALSELSYEDFLKLAKEYLLRENKKRLAILVEGALPKKNDISYQTISSKEIVDSFDYTSAQDFEIADLKK